MPHHKQKKKIVKVGLYEIAVPGLCSDIERKF
jgi:hypothetical protein